eukprot:TRINITY_DN17788_c0_g1_i1.p1 TRINITY_DN17788_c0_g1~~TRINITY_DN17788_c0_g1_i1.p1  ORF type:complete len:213 (-),score=46.82 TRINITY_DN17788_c0_g1_i1:301-918(-)
MTSFSTFAQRFAPFDYDFADRRSWWLAQCLSLSFGWVISLLVHSRGAVAFRRTQALECSSDVQSSLSSTKGGCEAKKEQVLDQRRREQLVTYVLVRKDLGWPVGRLLTQVGHVCMAVAWEARDDPEATFYMSEAAEQMTKVTLEVENEEELLMYQQRLGFAKVPCKLWLEQPEGIPVCLATWPRPRSRVNGYLKPLKLYAGLPAT